MLFYGAWLHEGWMGLRHGWTSNCTFTYSLFEFFRFPSTVRTNTESLTCVRAGILFQHHFGQTTGNFSNGTLWRTFRRSLNKYIQLSTCRAVSNFVAMFQVKVQPHWMLVIIDYTPKATQKELLLCFKSTFTWTAMNKEMCRADISCCAIVPTVHQISL